MMYLTIGVNTKRVKIIHLRLDIFRAINATPHGVGKVSGWMRKGMGCVSMDEKGYGRCHDG